ncbi:oligodendrocyte-myelin glycoprotein-like isoform X1 [Electrophorus electricus]|uniref:oligodendrocyte-myelin glycoprotein-like isoform X1 n=2 Tax=Electrophorus electricus TaxID=8005 RepID=UPI0015D08370|nr:oligodendrocyte-myelin glycoprotein-like isoform X1 [Electrophorus electricus]
MKRRCALKMRDCIPLSCLLLFLGGGIDAACPPACSCSDSHREVDCSSRSLRRLPAGLELKVHTLNLSCNRLSNLDHSLAPYTHLRTLDLSHNHLGHLPASLPRSLWELRASGNRIQFLEKNDTAYQWNLRELDLSHNRLERAVFINNTLPGLQALNLSHNHFWTVPTNMPPSLEVLDLSHNSLLQVLPGSLDRLASLARFYLHANRFSAVREGAFDGLDSLRLITLGDNQWMCKDPHSVGYLQAWVTRTPARVLGCPCHIRFTCGEAHLTRTGGWHFASYTLPPLLLPEKALTDTRHPGETPRTAGKPQEDGPSAPDMDTPTDVAFTVEEVVTSSTRRTTTLRTRSVKRASHGLGRNTSRGLVPWATLAICLNILLLIANDLLNY